MFKQCLSAIVIALVSTALHAETVQCKGTNVRVTGSDPGLIGRTCEAAKRADTLFASCRMPVRTSEIEIVILDDIAPGCVAQYHCGEGRIEVLAPAPMQALRDAEGVFAFLPIGDYFKSIIVHELAHAAYATVPCPENSCVATHEYLAYAMQILSLSEDQRATIDATSKLDRAIALQELSAMHLFLAPDLYVRKVWTHFSDLADPCAFIGEIAAGRVIMDRMMP